MSASFSSNCAIQLISIFDHHQRLLTYIWSGHHYHWLNHLLDLIKVVIVWSGSKLEKRIEDPRDNFKMDQNRERDMDNGPKRLGSQHFNGNVHIHFNGNSRWHSLGSWVQWRATFWCQCSHYHYYNYFAYCPHDAIKSSAKTVALMSATVFKISFKPIEMLGVIHCALRHCLQNSFKCQRNKLDWTGHKIDQTMKVCSTTQLEALLRSPNQYVDPQKRYKSTIQPVASNESNSRELPWNLDERWL